MLSPRVPGVTCGESSDQSSQEGGPALPIPTPSLNVSSLIRRCREREQSKTRGYQGASHPSAVAQDVEHRALQRLRSSLSAPAPPLTGTSSAAPAQPCCSPSLWGHPHDSNLWGESTAYGSQGPSCLLPQHPTNLLWKCRAVPLGLWGCPPRKDLLRCHSHPGRKRKCAFSVAAALRSRNEL